MIPLFGVLAGIVFLGETIDNHHIIALTPIIIGIVLANIYVHSQTEGSLIHENA